MRMRENQTSAYRLAFWGILALGLAVRLWRFGAVPGGLNQDEAFAGYEAWALLCTGRDSAGYTWPVYLTAWGSGMNALETYLMLPFMAVFGRQVWIVRLPQLLVACLSLPAFHDCLRRGSDEETALWGMLLLAICPWHVLLSRWGLESNLAPGFLLFGTCFFLRGLEDSRWLPISALFYGLALYSYATIWPILPAVLMIQGVYCALRGKLRLDPWLLLSLLLLALLALPLLLFLAVNLGWMEEIRGPVFSIPKLLVMRSGEISFRQIPENLRHLFTILRNQSDGLLWNSPGSLADLGRDGWSLSALRRCGGLYGLAYLITPPFVLLGLLLVLIRLVRAGKDFAPGSLLLFWLLAGLALGALVHVNVNRVNVIFLPLLALAAIGLRWFCALFRGKTATAMLLAAYLLLFGLFTGDFFNGERGYDSRIRYSFGYGLDSALAEAMEGEGTIVLDRHVYYSQVLFYSGTDPEDFRETVIYENYPAAYLRPTEFGRFRFGYSDGVPEDTASIILSPWTDGEALREAGFSCTHHGIYTLWQR